jgi:holin-like protein
MIFLLIGEALAGLGVGLPGNVIGMILLTLALSVGIVRTDQVERAADTLLDHLAFLFVPPGVGIMLYFGVVAEHWLAIGAALLISTVAVLLTVGLVTQKLLRAGSGDTDDRS